MPEPLVSIFVQAYNTEAFIGECLDSIFALRGEYAFEVIVIDDASTDGTAQVVRRYNDPRLRFIRHEQNHGAIVTANEGYGLARGRYVARIDSDDRYRPDFLARTIPLLEAQPKVGLVYGDIAMIDEHGRITAAQGTVRRNGRPAIGDEFFDLLEENFIPAPTTLMRREALEPLLPIPTDLRFLDWYLTVGIAEHWLTAYVDEVLADYRIHTTNMHRSMLRDRRGEATTFRILEDVFRRPARSNEKAAKRRRVYAANYLTYADKYFGCQMNAEARRCYLQAIRHRPALALRLDVMRRLAATVLGRAAYERIKAGLKR